MKKQFAILLSSLLILASCGGDESENQEVIVAAAPAEKVITKPYCFLVADAAEGEIVLQEGKACDKTASPNSTFKIAIALMGYDAHVLTTINKPLWKVAKSSREVCNQALTPTTWMQYSCIPYSRKITEELGEEKFKDYVSKLKYGNENVEGNPKKKDGLTHAWLDSSLMITPAQQLDFLLRFQQGTLDVSKAAQAYVEALLYDEKDSPPTYYLFGKTGSGNAHGEQTEQGWYIGWYTHHSTGKRVFVYYGYASGEQVKMNGQLAKQFVLNFLKADQKTPTMLAVEAEKAAEKTAALAAAE